MRVINSSEFGFVSGGIDAGDVPQYVVDIFKEKGLLGRLWGIIGGYYTVMELLGDVDDLMNGIPRQDLQWGSEFNGLGSPGDGTVPGDPNAGCNVDPRLIIQEPAGLTP